MSSPTESSEALLARLDERTKNTEKRLDELLVLHTESTKQIISTIEKHGSEDDRRFAEHDKRLKALEGWRWWIMGAIALAAGIIGYLK